MIEFVKPENLDGNVLEAELLKVGITLPPRSITVVGDQLFLEIAQKDKAKAQSVLDAISA
jgi:hypothetical protein